MNLLRSEFPIWRNIIILVFSLLCTLPLQAQLSGNYTIDANGTGSANFTSFSQAVAALQNQGVSGAVTFSVANGTYTEQLQITAIAGASVNSAITFKSSSGDSSLVTLSYPSSALVGNNYVIALNGAGHVTFKGITISRTGTENYARVVEIQGGSDNINFLNNRITGVYSGTAGNTFRALIYSPGGNDNNNRFANNRFLNGSHAIYCLGFSSGSPETGTVIEYNYLDSLTNAGIYLEYQSAPIVRFNNVNVTGISSNAIYMISCHFDIKVNNNHITALQGGYGLRFTNCQGRTNQRGTIFNNSIIVGGNSTAWGLFINNVTYQDILHNSVNIISSSTTNGRAYVAGGISSLSSNKLYNNIFANTGGGYSFYISNNVHVAQQNHNNYYTSGSVLGNYSGLDVADLSAWQNITWYDANSLSVNPQFTGPTDLHVKEITLNGAGDPANTVLFDFDGELRSTTSPDIGADEFFPVGNDAAITKLLFPINACEGAIDITLEIMNFGLNTIDSLKITFLLNGIIQTSQFYSLGGLSSGKDTVITIGTVNMTDSITTFGFYSELPNNSPDEYPGNDTLTQEVQILMSGIYSIGGNNADYPDFTGAVDDLVKRGVCGAVIFNVADGTYNEQIRIPEIVGASDTNTVTFQSSSADSSLVVLTHPSSSDATTSHKNYVLQLYGAAYVTFKQISIERSGGGYYGTVIDLNAFATNNKFLNNRMSGSYNTVSTHHYSSIVYSSGNSIRNTFVGNVMRRSTSGIYLPSSYPILESGTIIERNEIDSIHTKAIYLYQHKNATVRYNNIIVTGPVGYGIEMRFCNGQLQVNNNYVKLERGGYGIHYSSCEGTANNRGLAYNNIVLIDFNVPHGIYLHNCTNQDIMYNSVRITSAYGTGAALELVNGNNNTLYNNMLVNTGKGYAINLSQGSVSASNHNNLYSADSILGKFGGTETQSLTDWQSVSQLDNNSVSVHPRFLSHNNLLPQTVALNNLGQPVLGIDHDFHNLQRGSTPDIGAIEFTPPANDIAVMNILAPETNTCGDSNTRVGFVLHNYGTNTQSNFAVGVTITDIDTVIITDTYTGMIAPDESDTFYLSNGFNSYTGGSFTVKAYANLQNDSRKNNDTITGLVDIHPIPVSTFLLTTNQKTITLTPDAPGAAKYLWNFGDGQSTFGNSVTYTYNSDGTYQISLTVTTDEGCSSTSSDSVTIQTTGITREWNSPLQLTIYPNPFRDETKVRYTLAHNAHVQVSLYDGVGRQVTILADNLQASGEHSLIITAKENNLRAGLYFIRIKTNKGFTQKQMILLK